MFRRYEEVFWRHEISHFLVEDGLDTSHTREGIERARTRLARPYSRMQAFRTTNHLRNPSTGIDLLKDSSVLSAAGTLSGDLRERTFRRRIGKVDILEPKKAEVESLYFIYGDGQGPRKLSALAAYGVEQYLRGYDKRWSENSKRLIEEYGAAEEGLFDSNLSYLLERLDLRDE